MSEGAGASAVADLQGMRGSGGENLSALYKQVGNIKSKVASDAAARFRDAATDAGNRGKAVQQAVNTVQDKWEGEAAEAFVSYMNRFTKAGKDVETSLTQAAETMDEVSNVLENLKTDVDKALSNAAQEAKNVEKEAKSDIAAAEKEEDPDPAPEAIREKADGELTEIKTSVSDKVEGIVEQAESVLQEKMGGMKVDLDGDGFAGIETPSATGTSPANVSSVGAMGAGNSAAPAGGGGTGGGGFGGAGAGGDAGGGTGGGGGGLGPSGGPPAGPVPGNVEKWITKAIRILQENGLPVSEENIDEIWQIIEHESAGDPRAINLWDSNAAAGHPSKGLMQTIDSTFNAHKLPGHGDIWDPVDNIIAGVRYTFDRYGGFENHPGLASMASGGGYQGY